LKQDDDDDDDDMQKKILHTETESKFDETVDHIISACQILAKE
jgi:hypothetical protein